MRHPPASLLLTAAMWMTSGCGDPDAALMDAGGALGADAAAELDGRATGDAEGDTKAPDARSRDGAASLDQDPSDATAPDVSARVDARAPDAQASDTGPSDAQIPDAQAPDAGPSDAQIPDAQAPDAAPLPVIEFCATPDDEDGDGLAGCADPDCRGAPACFHVRETCDDGVDNDGNLDVDCDDGFCVLDPECPAPDVAPFDDDELQARFDLDCGGCHDANEPFAGLDLSAPFRPALLDVPAAGAEMALLKAGDRRQSYVFLKISWRHLEAFGEGEGMPPEHQWNAVDVERLGRWIDGL